MTLLFADDAVSVHHADWRALLDVVREAGGCDAVIVDAPYSARVHGGHDGGVSGVNARREAYAAAGGNQQCRGERREIDYPPWSDVDVAEFVVAWAPLVRGWMVSITDHVLAETWARSAEGCGRYAFAPLPLVEPGSRVRLAGDGPSSWTTWIVVARPRTAEAAKWGTLPGAYVLPPERGRAVVGGKSIDAMRALVRDYTRPGDLVVDPCGGGGTTALACRLEGRRCITGDAMLEHAEIAAERLRALPSKADKRGTLALFGGS